MLLSRVLLLLPSALLSAAQSPTTSSAVPTHTIAAGADPFKFTPNEVNANVGDIIEFRFYPTNHSVARAEYLFPCIPYEVTGVNKVGFWSGFEPIYIVGVDQPKYQVRVNDTKPIFYYCGAPGACIVDGMVGVINPNSTQTWEAQHEAALNATQAFVPGEYFSPEGVPTTPPSIASATSMGSSSPATSSASTSPTQNASPGKSSSLSTGAIVGIAIGAAAIAVLAAALFYLYGRQKTMKEILQNSQNKPGFSGRESYVSGQTSPYPFSGHKSPIVVEYLSQGPDQYSGAGPLGEQHIRSNPLDSESYRSRSPPIDDRGRDTLIQPLNMDANGAPSPHSPSHFERHHDFINGAYRTSTPRGQLPDGEEEHNIQPRDSEHRTDDGLAALRAANVIPQRMKTTGASIHEMPVPSQNTGAASLYNPSSRIDVRQEVLTEK
ncbi:hypothetical protein N431DRAFT_370749 [Stipitochalara longipes BDJ]|nr:hypothetical protein N431DRAFT_370749 [Stipitochalara longipes BDJ]